MTDPDHGLGRGVPPDELHGLGARGDQGRAGHQHHDEQDHEEVDRDRAALGLSGHLDRGPVQRPHRPVVAAVRAEGDGDRLLDPGDDAAPEEEHEPQGQRHGREDQRRSEPVPELEHRLVGTGRELLGVREDGAGGRRAGEAEGERETGEHRRRYDEPCVGAVHRRRRRPGLGGEGAPHEARGVGDGEDGAERDAGHEQPAADAGQAGAVAVLGDVDQRHQHALLGEEAEERRQRRPSTAPPAPQTAATTGIGTPDSGELAEVTGPGAVVDDADGEEQGGLEQGVRHEHRQAGERRRPGADAGDHQQEPELAHRAVGEQELDVVLAERPPAPEQHRHDAEHQQDLAPPGDAGEGGRQQGDQVDAGLDHGGGVQVGAHRGRGGHRAREPEVERHQRRLADRPGEEQERRRTVTGAGRRVGQDAR